MFRKGSALDLKSQLSFKVPQKSKLLKILNVLLLRNDVKSWKIYRKKRFIFLFLLHFLKFVYALGSVMMKLFRSPLKKRSHLNGASW